MRPSGGSITSDVRRVSMTESPQAVRPEVVHPTAGGRLVRAGVLARFGHRRPPALGLGSQWRNAAVGRIDHQRRAPGLDDRVAAVEPERVVVADDVVRHLIVAGRVLGCPDVLELGRLFSGQELPVGKILRALHRRDGAEVPDPLQVGMSPGRARDVALRGGRDGNERRERQNRQNAHDLSA